MNIYFSASIRGGREDSKLYGDLINFLSTQGNVLTHHTGDQKLTFIGEGEGQILKQHIISRNMQWMSQSNVFIAEVTTPSLGVGYEIAKAEEKNLPILCLYRKREGKSLSAMIEGSTKIITKHYATLEEAQEIIITFLQSF